MKCRICKNDLVSILTYNNMPKSAQNFPDETNLDKDIGVDLDICQCVGCDLVQLSNEPVPYYREVIRASAFSEEMKEFRLKQFNKFVNKYSLKGKKILEAGCGKGEYLSLMNEFGIDGYGTEYAIDSVEQCKENGLKVSQMFIEDGTEKIEGGKFDAFFILNFFEHLPNPNITLKGISSNLNEGGIGLVEVPNFDMMLKNNMFSEFINDHLFYFTKDTLESTLSMNGFEVLECKDVWYDYITSAVVKKRDRLDISHFKNYKEKVKKEIHDYINMFGNKRVAIWGAGHQALAIMSMTELSDRIRYVVDDAPFKQNKFTPATHIPIVSADTLDTDSVDAIIVMAASYSDEVIEKVKKKYRQKIHLSVLRDTGVKIIAENKETKKKATTMSKHLGGKTGLKKDKVAPVKGQKEFVSEVTGETWVKDSIIRWHNVINKQAVVNEDQNSKAKGGGTKTLPKGSVVFIDDIRGRINPQYRCKDSSGNIWFIRTRFIDMMEEDEKLGREELNTAAEKLHTDNNQFIYRGGVRVGEHGGDAADSTFKHRNTGKE